MLSNSAVLSARNSSAEYAKLPAAEQKFFMQCPDCREMFDLPNLEEIVFHLAHRNPPLESDFVVIQIQIDATFVRILQLFHEFD